MGVSRQIILLLMCAGWPSVSVGTVLNVPTAAYPTIQSAIQAAVAGDEVVVAPGVYNEHISFGATPITVRSSGGSAVTTIDASGLDFRVVTFFPGSGPATQLSDFTITGGQRLGTEPQDRGAGIYCNRASPTISNCIVEGNLAVFGGGLATWLGDPTVTNCVFRNNRATFRGGAVSNSRADPSFDQCTFQLNQADQDGGAMANHDSSPTLTDCFFEQNSAGLLAGGMYSRGFSLGAADPTITGCTFRFNTGVLGGGIYSGRDSQPVIRDSLFAENSSQKGAAVFIEFSHLDVSGCVFDANTVSDRGGAIFVGSASVTISDSLFVGNTATFFGGAVSHSFSAGSIYSRNRFIANSSRYGGAVFAREGSSPQFVNCLFDHNRAVRRGGAIAVENAAPSAVNCTMVANVAVTGGRTLSNDGGSVSLTNCIMRNGGTEIVQGGGARTTVAYSNIEGSWPGNINEDPRFVDADGVDGLIGTVDDDLRLLFGSPSIDAGDNTAVPLDVTTDLDGNPRFIDNPATADTGNGTPPIVDMGAYELTCGDGVVDPTEECDDGNGSHQDSCLNNCVLNVCGDGFLNIGVEECDDGNTESGDGCDKDCLIEPGACCLGTACSIATDSDCLDSGGTFFGFNTTCDAPDADGDGLRNECDGCPDDSNKIEPGICGCGVDDTADSDNDGVPDCEDQCPGVDDAVFAPDCVGAIPTTSQWGLMVLTLLLLAGGKILFGIRARPVARY